IYTENRTGDNCFFPMTSLSVGLVSPASTCLCQSHVDIADLASEAKKMAKKIEGNSFFINQRMTTKGQENLLPFTHRPVSKLHAVN
ncbi:MAG: GGDEF domain-containing protein, partial [Candidatus Paceibacterota bacterium]